EGKRTLFIDGDSSVAAGNAFLERLGGRHGITMEINALKLSELDRDLMQSWIDRGKRLGSDYQLLDWRDDIPEEHFERFVELIHVMNSAPTENLDLEDFVLTPEQVRHYERARKARGQRLWTRIARHRGSGALAGYTELHWDPSNPPIFQQADTAVDPAHRGHGLGRWLKAANLLSAMQDMPAATWVRTGNAGSNEAMLAINRAMGFKLHKTITGWQFEIEALAAALQARRAAAGAGA
ncbi:MAG TPA: GNAT family N-acetyltransferase, partial [Gemmatimonadota bacterium]|nr:GNAT family N-acetyltransferase [Gemmatimonadota bacterium]